MDRCRKPLPSIEFHDDMIRTTVSQNLRGLMREHNISQIALHKAVVDSAHNGNAKLSLRAIKNYMAVERTKSSTNPSVNTLQEIARGLRHLGLDVTESWIVCRHDYTVVNKLRRVTSDEAQTELKRYIYAFIASLEQISSDSVLLTAPDPTNSEYNAELINTVTRHIESVFDQDHSVQAIAIVLEIISERREQMERRVSTRKREKASNAG